MITGDIIHDYEMASNEAELEDISQIKKELPNYYTQRINVKCDPNMDIIKIRKKIK